MKKVAFYTLGCKLNFSETSTLARQLRQRGYQQVDFSDQPDVYIINTCSVTENADRKCRKIVREALTHAPEAFIAIVGCYAQLKPREIAKIPGVDAVLGAAEKFQLVELLDGFQKKSHTQVMACEIESAGDFHAAYSLEDRTRTFLKVQDGCDYSCAFCTIPLARGKSRSNTIENVVQQAREIAHRGVKEIVLTGVNVGDFGIIEGRRQQRFEDLVKALDQEEQLERIRISSIEPNLLTQGIIELVAKSNRFLPHFHIPLQSGSDAVLKKMKRRYLRDLYREKVELIKEQMPFSCIGSDVIVGFPGETEALFKETYEFLVERPVDYLHVFSYSERPNTLAITMDQVVPAGQRAQRSKMLRILSEKKRRHFYERCQGRPAKVLFEHDLQGGMLHGYSENYVRVGIPYQEQLVGNIVEVELGQILPSGVMEGQLTQSALV